MCVWGGDRGEEEALKIEALQVGGVCGGGYVGGGWGGMDARGF